ncbi:hypothetical protein JTB14_005773 [Gonioctena quinquepunctata]|nr:hypothetical protein JTB14_005773 [Gonioctena quinquepunctata]
MENTNPKDTAGIFSTLFFGYTFGIFRKGYKKTLGVEDLYNPLKSDRSTVLGDRLERNWEKQLAKLKVSNGKPNLLKALAATFWGIYLQSGLMVFFTDVVLRITQPIMLGGLLDYFKPKSETSKDYAFYCAGGLVGITVLRVFTANLLGLALSHSGLKARAAVCALMYRKSLKLSKTAVGDTAAGKIVNLLSNDVSRFDICSRYIHQMWCAPLCGLIVMGLIYKDSGYAGMIGVVAVFTVVPIQSYTGQLSAKYRKQTASKTDERVRLMDEIISGIQVIKMYAWEKPFEKVVKFARNAEIRIITKSSHIRAIFMTFAMFTTRFALFCTLLTMSLTGREITAAKAFVFMSYFNILSLMMSTLFVRAVSEVAELLVAIKRIQHFLLCDELQLASLMEGHESEDSKEHVILKNLTVKYNMSSIENALENINLTIPRGNLFGIIGPVGSGKSSLLQTVLVCDQEKISKSELTLPTENPPVVLESEILSRKSTKYSEKLSSTKGETKRPKQSSVSLEKEKQALEIEKRQQELEKGSRRVQNELEEKKRQLEDDLKMLRMQEELQFAEEENTNDQQTWQILPGKN